MSMRIESDAFEADQPIPGPHARLRGNLSPPLRWEGAPADAKQLALVVDDPDAPGDEPWVHWLIYNIPPEVKQLPKGVKAEQNPAEPTSTAQGRNSWGEIGYGGPQPPAGHGTHYYRFHLYALDVEPTLPAGLTKEALMEAAAGHIRDEAELVGTYETS
jgi:hypothetical protein